MYRSTARGQCRSILTAGELEAYIYAIGSLACLVEDLESKQHGRRQLVKPLALL